MPGFERLAQFHFRAQGGEIAELGETEFEVRREPFGLQRKSRGVLLGNDVLVIELLDLSRIEPGPYELVCLPLKLAIGDGAPARVLLVRAS